MNRVTQDMKFRQSIMIYAQKYGVSRASRKYNKSRSFIYFWMDRYDGTLESLACRSRRPHCHPNQHTPAELKLIRDMRRRNPELGMIELWFRLKKRGYKRCRKVCFVADFENQLSIYLRRSNNMPMRPLHWLSPSEFLQSHTVQYV
jgi:transposase